MADEQKNLNEITDLPQEVREWLASRAAGEEREAKLDALLPGNSWAGVRKDLTEKGAASYRDEAGRESWMVADISEEGHVMGLAAAVPRNPGTSYDFVNQIGDFKDALTTGGATNRKDALALFHRVYRADGMTNNAISKLAALVAPKGSFKVKSVKGQRGKSGDKRAIEFQTLVNWWKDNVNARGEDQVITGDRGITAFVSRGARLCFIEGDHIARHFWPKKAVAVPNLGTYTLPMNLQSFSAQHIEIPEGLEGTNYELLYWAPPKDFIKQLTEPKDPNVGKLLKKLIPSDVRNALVNDGMYLLDPGLLIHIKHKGLPTEPFGESLIEATLSDIRFKRALDALMLSVITNVIARMVVVKIGSDNKDSVYHKQEVSAARLGMLQRAMQRMGTAGTVLWGGPDLEIVQVSAHDSLPAVEGLYKIAERRHLMSLGMPAVMMIGEGTDGKAAAFGAALAVAGLLTEIQEQYAQALKSIAERIAMENGFEEVDVVWEWHENKLDDKNAAAELILKLWQAALLDADSALEELGYEPDAVRTRMDQDVKDGIREGIFQPPKGLQTGATTNPAGDGGDTGGAPKGKDNGASDREGKEMKNLDPQK